MDDLFKIGDLVNEKEGPARAGIIVEIKEHQHTGKTISVLWRTGKKTNYKPAWLESFHTEGGK